MSYTNSDLFNAFTDAMPLGFLTELNHGVSGVYSEAYEMAHSSPVIIEPDADYLMPHNRRAIFETFVRSTAIRNGLQASSIPNKRNTSFHSFIQIKNFYLTASYVNEPEKFVRKSKFRNTYAALNGFLSQQTIFGFEPEHSLSHCNNGIYCVLLHGPDKNDKTKYGFMEFAFPDINNNSWVDIFKFSDVLYSVQNKTTTTTNIIDKAMPTLKIQKKSGEQP